MALYRLELKRHSRTVADVAARAAYRSATRILAAAAYRAGDHFNLGGGRGRDRQIDYSRRFGVVDAFIEAPPDAPDWARDRGQLWWRVDHCATRKNALLALETVISLPRDLPLDAAMAAVREWVRQEIVDAHGLVADAGVHGYGRPLDPNIAGQKEHLDRTTGPDWPVYDAPADGVVPRAWLDHPHLVRHRNGTVRAYQPHVHVMFTVRAPTETGFGKKNRDLDRKAQLHRWRHSWAEVQNELLARHGHAQVSAKAGWKRRLDAAKAAGDTALAARLAATEEPRQVDCGGGWHAHLEGRLPETLAMDEHDPMEFNVALSITKQERDAEKAARAAAEAGRAVAERERDAAKKAIAAAPTADERVAAALEVVRRHQRRGVRFVVGTERNITTDPPGAVPKEEWSRLSGQHAAVAAVLERDELGRAAGASRERIQVFEQAALAEPPPDPKPTAPDGPADTAIEAILAAREDSRRLRRLRHALAQLTRSIEERFGRIGPWLRRHIDRMDAWARGRDAELPAGDVADLTAEVGDAATPRSPAPSSRSAGALAADGGPEPLQVDLRDARAARAFRERIAEMPAAALAAAVDATAAAHRRVPGDPIYVAALHVVRDRRPDAWSASRQASRDVLEERERRLQQRGRPPAGPARDGR